MQINYTSITKIEIKKTVFHSYSATRKKLLQIDMCSLSVCMHPSLLVLFFAHHTMKPVGILVPQPGNEPRSPALAAQSPNPWTAGDSPPQYYTN